MRFKGLGIVVFAMAMICAPGVQAGDSEDFSGCDGLLKPKAKDDGMRGQASTSSFSFMFQGSDAKSKIASCNRALANPKLRPTQTLRRAHLLRARAAAHLKVLHGDGMVMPWQISMPHNFQQKNTRVSFFSSVAWACHLICCERLHCMNRAITKLQPSLPNGRRVNGHSRSRFSNRPRYYVQQACQKVVRSTPCWKI